MPPSLEFEARYLALVIPKPEADDDDEEEDPKEDPIDVKGDDVDHEDGVNEADVGQIGDADEEEKLADDQPEDDPPVGEHLLVELEEDADDDDDVGMEIGDDALPPDELEEDFVEDAKEGEIDPDKFLLQEEDEDDDAEILLFEGLVANFDEQIEEDLEEIILPTNEIPPVSSSDEEC